MENEDFVCLTCEFVVKIEDEYCPNCGTIFMEDKKCYLHKEDKAQGTCLICLKLCCKKCGLFVNRVHLCNEHSNYEIIEGMGRIYGSSDYIELSFFKDILEKEGLHPFLYRRSGGPFSLGSVGYSLFEVSSDFGGYLINEIKLMLPLGEINEAEKILEPLIDDRS